MSNNEENSHNSKILNADNEKKTSKNIEVYQATIEQNNSTVIGSNVKITENDLKSRYNQHLSSFRLKHK